MVGDRLDRMNDLYPNSPATEYREAGVNIELADQLVHSWQAKFARTARPERIDSRNGFSGLFEVPQGYRSPVLVSSTDGVGTKLKLAFELQRHATIGIDLVAMCVNDVLVCGAEPLYFLDYFASGRLDGGVANQVMDGIVAGCELARTDLIGGETAEMPGMYVDGEYDLAGFCVGIVEKSAILDGAQVTENDVVIGLSSSGFHSNGYSLLRKIITDYNLSWSTEITGQRLDDLLMTPTTVYVKVLRDVISSFNVHAFAHITGGGLAANLARVIPDRWTARINTQSWHRAPVFNWIQTVGNLSEMTMLETFNCGIGMVAIVPSDSVTAVRSRVESHGVETSVIGTVQPVMDDRKVLME